MVLTKRSKGKGSGKYERMNYRIDQMRPIDDYRQALENFRIPDPSELNREFGEVTAHPDPLIEEYFNVVAMTGASMVKWSIVKDAFVWKLEKVLNDIRLVEDDLKPAVYIDKRLTPEELDAIKDFMIEKAKTFENAPFTIQRLCELLALPTVHYRIAEKLYRAVEKNINVVMEVSEDGKRITGVEEPIFFDDDAASSICETEDHIEKHFLVCVDEVDKSLEEQKRESMERSDSSEDDEDSRGSFRTPLKFEVLDRPETPPPNDEVLRLSTDEVVPMEQQFGIFGNKKKSPFKEPMIDMFADVTEDHHGHHKRSPSSSEGGVFLTPEMPIKSPQKRESSVDNSGDAHVMTEEEFQEEIPTKMPKDEIPEPMDS